MATTGSRAADHGRGLTRCGHYASEAEISEFDDHFLWLIEEEIFDDPTPVPFVCSVCEAACFYLSATRLQVVSMLDMICNDRRMHPK